MSTFKEWNQQQREQQQTSDRLREVATRRWMLDKDYKDFRVPYRNEPVEFVFYVSSYPVDDGEVPVTGVSIATGDSVDRLPAKALRRVAAVKQLFEDWATGKLVELPADVPDAITQLP